jgi:hypothetical protein
MDHLPPIISPAAPSILVHTPWPHYDKQEFSGYPARMGWEKRFFEHEEDFTNRGTKRPEETAILLFEWLYFGMIYELLGDVFGDFLDGGSNNKLTGYQYLVTTRNLQKHLTLWHARVRMMNMAQVQEEQLKVENCLYEVHRIMACHHREGHRNCAWPLTDDVSILIISLMETFDNSRTLAFYTKRKMSHSGGLLDSLRVASIEKTMSDARWCPNQINMCRIRFNISSQYYASRLQRPLQRSHKSCSAEQCVAYQIHEMELVPKHTSVGCECLPISSQGEKLKCLIGKEAIPLAKLSFGTDGNDILLEIIEACPKQEYVAISHVWSHGLGNAVGNSLPTCQIKRIMSIISQHSDPPHLFWLDTLCLPRDPLPLRVQAVHNIRTIYEQAQRVLVFDEELLYTTLDHSQTVEVLMRIMLSGWMRRLWTLHEQAVSTNLWFQFSNGAVRQDTFLNRVLGDAILGNGATEPISDTVALQTASLIANTSKLRNEKGVHDALARLWNSLRWRETSWNEDETICMANILKCDRQIVEELQNTSFESRMRRFLDLFTTFPKGLAFLPGPRMQEAGLGWAPLSWLIRRHNRDDQRELRIGHQEIAQRTSWGLLFSCHILLLEPSTRFPYTKEGQCFCLVDDSTLYTLHVVTRITTESHILQEKPDHVRFALCIEEDSERAVPSHQGFHALLVSLDENLNKGNEGILYARYQSTLVGLSFLNTKGVVPPSTILSLSTDADGRSLAVERCTSVMGLCCVG